MKGLFSYKPILLLAIGILFVDCSRTLEIEKLLLSPADFPGQQLRVEQVDSRELETGGRSAEVVLIGKDYRVYHSVIVLQDAAKAREMMEALKNSPESLGAKVGVAPALGQETLGVFKDRSSGNRLLLLFREDKVLVRVTLEGGGSQEDLELLARKAWEKVR